MDRAFHAEARRNSSLTIALIFLIFILACIGPMSSPAHSEATLQFVGDILLSREVETELRERPGASPWQDVGFPPADFRIGNFEGAVGSKDDCAKKNSEICFAVDGGRLALLKNAGFSHLSLENNHGLDTGELGKQGTQKRLALLGIESLSFARSPTFIHKGQATISLIAVDWTRLWSQTEWEELDQKLAMARQLSNWVVVVPHWGKEFADWPTEQMKARTRWLISRGTDVIIGHHPHVVIPPACVDGHPVFYSLGNHLFDQKFKETHRGMLASCSIREAEGKRTLACGFLETVRSEGSSFPRVIARAGGPVSLNCEVAEHPLLQVRDTQISAVNSATDGDYALLLSSPGRIPRQTSVLSLLSAGKMGLPSGESLFISYRDTSTFDDENVPRPSMFSVDHEEMRPVWQGTSFAFPMIEARPICRDEDCSICVLHRGDSFLRRNRDTKARRVMSYAWSRFGFQADLRNETKQACQMLFSALAPQVNED